MEPPRKQPHETDSNKPYDEGIRPEVSHPPRTPAVGSSNPERRRVQASQKDGADMLNRPLLKAGGTDSRNGRPRPGRPGQLGNGEGRQSSEPSELRGSEGADRRRKQPTTPAQQRLNDNDTGRSNPPQSRDGLQNSRIGPNGPGTGSHGPEAGECDGKNCQFYQRIIELQPMLDKIMQIVYGRSRADNTRQNSLRDGPHPREQARRRQMHQEREQMAELEDRQQMKDPKLPTERPMTDQGRGAGKSDVTARSSAPVPSKAQPGLRAAQQAMRNKTAGMNAPRRSAEGRGGLGNGSSSPVTRAPVAPANSRAPPPKDPYGLD
jgi:hypothetical protein